MAGPEFGLRDLAVHLSRGYVRSCSLQREIAKRVPLELSAVPLHVQRSIIRALWPAALHKQQLLVKFGSPVEDVRRHYPEYPLDKFEPPRVLSTAQLLVLLPYLVGRAGLQRQYQVEQRLREDVDNTYLQDALNVLATAFRKANQSAEESGRPHSCSLLVCFALEALLGIIVEATLLSLSKEICEDATGSFIHVCTPQPTSFMP